MTIRHNALKSIVVTLAILLAVACRSDEQEKSAENEDPMRGEKAGQERDDNGLKMKFVWCPRGGFEMGETGVMVIRAQDNDSESDPSEEGVVDLNKATDNEPERTELIHPVKVFLTHGYWLGKYEVTQREWRQVMQTKPWESGDRIKEGDDFPATYVSWDDAIDFCRKLTQREREAGLLPGGWEYTLPTEAQWERACRAQTSTRYSFGDDKSQLGEYAWFYKSVGREQFAHRVGQKRHNPWGLHDIHGNVWEWCRDASQLKLPGGRDPEVIRKSSFRVLRGGCWSFGTNFCESACRHRDSHETRTDFIGFRVALSSVQPAKPASGAGSEGSKGARR